MSDLINASLVRLDADLGTDKHDVIRALARVVDDAGRATDADQLVEDAFAREAKSGDRPARRHRDPALPHRRRRGADAGVRPARADGRLRRQGRPGRPGLPDRGPRGRRRHPPAAAHQARPVAGQGGVHRRAARGADAARRSPTWSTRSSATPRPPRPLPPRRPPPRRPAGRRSLVAVTACPTGIAHTYMAAEALEAAAERAGVDIAGRDPGLGRRHAARRPRPSPPPTR